MNVFATFTLSAVAILTAGTAYAADDFEVLPEVYGACIAVNKSADGNVRNDCLSAASIVNKADGSIYACEGHLAVNIEGVSLNTTVGYQKAHCTLANAPAHSGEAAPSSVAEHGDFAPRRSPAGGASATVPAHFVWRTRRDKLAADVCFDFIGFRAYSGCIEAPLQK